LIHPFSLFHSFRADLFAPPRLNELSSPRSMKPETYARSAAVEERHWWYRARGSIIKTMLHGCGLPSEASILDIGCGTGFDYQILSAFGCVTGVDAFAEAIDHCRARGHRALLQDATNLQFADDTFDLTCCLDALTCIEDDRKAVEEALRVTRPGGIVLVTACANPRLWGQTDLWSQNYRRYTKQSLQRLFPLERCSIQKATYFNTLLFPLIYLSRKLERADGEIPGISLPPPLVNKMLLSVFAAERHLLPHLSVPFGVSLLLIARKAAGLSSHQPRSTQENTHQPSSSFVAHPSPPQLPFRSYGQGQEISRGP
jgi:SAM-dependent methyltransferase